MNVEALARSLAVSSNDMLFVVYLSSLVRSILALHRLIENKEARQHAEREAIKGAAEKKEKAAAATAAAAAAKAEGEAKAAADGGPPAANGGAKENGKH